MGEIPLFLFFIKIVLQKRLSVIAEQRLKRARAWVEAFLSSPQSALPTQTYLVDFVMRNVNGREIVELYLDTDEGITIDACARLTRAMLDALETDADAKEIFGENLRLEISSPGVSRPLLLPRQYKKNIGRRLRVQFLDASCATQVVEGTLLAVRNLESENAEIELDTSPKQSSKAKKHRAKQRGETALTSARVILPLALVKEAIVQVEF